jgi:transcriptional regulator with XRE-family HTH domain
MSEYQNSLKSEFQDEDYRYAYAEDYLNTSIATQIKVLREQRRMTQQELATKIGTKQAGVSRLENVNYSAWKTQTLRKIGRALGVRLKITFETFGTLLDETAGFSREALQRPDFAEDPAFQPVVLGQVEALMRPQMQLQPQTPRVLDRLFEIYGRSEQVAPKLLEPPGQAPGNIVQMPLSQASEELGPLTFVAGRWN